MRKRIVTLLIGVLIFIAVFYLDSLKLVSGALFYNIAMAICSFLMCHEFYKALEAKGFKPLKLLGYLSILFLIPIGVIESRTMMLCCAITIPILFLIGMSIPVFTKLKYNISDVAVTLMGNVYVVFMVSFLCATRALPMGVFLIFYIFCGAWFSDIFAYLFGRWLGKHKFSQISPKKSIEGCIAGLLGTVVFFIVYSAILNVAFTSNVPADAQTLLPVEPIFSTQEEQIMNEKLQNGFYTNYPLLIILGIVISALSQIGDLAASGIKRYCDIKDFSHLMPGHGGMLDRFDSVLFISPMLYYVFYLIYIIN